MLLKYQPTSIIHYVQAFYREEIPVLFYNIIACTFQFEWHEVSLAVRTYRHNMLSLGCVNRGKFLR